mgnify:CR=1 FL=1
MTYSVSLKASYPEASTMGFRRYVFFPLMAFLMSGSMSAEAANTYDFQNGKLTADTSAGAFAYDMKTGKLTYPSVPSIPSFSYTVPSMPPIPTAASLKAQFLSYVPSNIPTSIPNFPSLPDLNNYTIPPMPSKPTINIPANNGPNSLSIMIGSFGPYTLNY